MFFFSFQSLCYAEFVLAKHLQICKRLEVLTFQAVFDIVVRKNV